MAPPGGNLKVSGGALWGHHQRSPFSPVPQFSSLTPWIIFLAIYPTSTYGVPTVYEALLYTLGKPEEQDSLGLSHQGANTGLSVHV